jgi:PTS system ascorbate-specific IIA component
MAINLADELSESAIITNAPATDWRSALTFAGEALVASGVTTAAYTAEMIAAVEELGPYIVIAPGLALAHSRPSPAVLRAGLSWVSLETPIEFGHAVNDPVSLVIGLAAPDHESHIEVMSALAGVLADDDRMKALAAADTPARVRGLLASYADGA